MGEREHPAHAGQRSELLQAERERWAEFSTLVRLVPTDRMEEPTVNEDGWSIKDLLWHMASWDAEIGEELEKMCEGTFVDHDWETEAKNASFLEEGRRLDVETVQREWLASHERALAAMNAIADVTPEVEEWFSEAAYKHPDDHLPELRRFVGEQRPRES